MHSSSTIRHHHACQRCGAQTPCTGQLEDNYDGEPAIVCTSFHLQNGEVDQDFVCEACTCVDCGERGTVLDTVRNELLCEPCALDRDNYEPPDPDGEDIFRDYQAEARDACATAQRLK